MARKNMIDDGSYQEKQKLKTRKNFFDFTQKELDEARDKEQEQSRKVAEHNARYGMNMMGPSKKSNKMSKPVAPEKEDIKYKFSIDELKNMSTNGKTMRESIKFFAGDQDENENSHHQSQLEDHYRNIPEPYPSDDAVKKALKSKKGGKTIGESIKFFAGDQDENEESHGYEDQHFENIPQNQYDDAVKNFLSKSKKKK